MLMHFYPSSQAKIISKIASFRNRKKIKTKTKYKHSYRIIKANTD